MVGLLEYLVLEAVETVCLEPLAGRIQELVASSMNKWSVDWKIWTMVVVVILPAGTRLLLLVREHEVGSDRGRIPGYLQAIGRDSSGC